MARSKYSFEETVSETLTCLAIGLFSPLLRTNQVTPLALLWSRWARGVQADQTDHLTEVKGIFEVIRRTDYKISNLNGPLYYSGQIDSQLIGDIMRAVPSLVDFLLVADQEYVEDFIRVLLPFATYYRQGGHNHLALRVVSDFHLSPFTTVVLGMGKYDNASLSPSRVNSVMYSCIPSLT